MGITDGLYYFISNLMYWLWSFKYWVISIEIPNVIAAQKARNDEDLDVSKRDTELIGKKSVCSESKY
jgi:hypothetical protein